MGRISENKHWTGKLVMDRRKDENYLVRQQLCVSDSLSSIWLAREEGLLLEDFIDLLRVVEEYLIPKTIRNFPGICP